MNARRLACPVCARPANACICRWIAPLAHPVEVLILQHPLEVAHAKNSGGLLHLCLPQSRILVGESFTDGSALATPWRDGAARRLVLLYPGTPLDQAADLAPPPVLDPAWLCEPSRLRLVVLDGTWRKSRKMLYRSPALQQLPRLSLQDLPASKYRIRKAHRPDQLSSFEATCMALMQLVPGETEGEGEEGTQARFQPLLDAFDGFVAQQAAYRAQHPL